jgi:hypothetical protein
MSIQDLEKVINDNTIPLDVAEKYLTLFLGEYEWKKSISRLWDISGSKKLNEEDRKLFVKKSISCAALISYTEKTTIPELPENLLFWCSGWAQFNERDWFQMFQDLVRKDIEIIQNRNKIIMLGVIDPIDISPLTRQAFNWLYDQAKSSDSIDADNAEEVKLKFSNLVKAYGGAVICNLFVKHKKSIQDVFNWRSGYFFERELHKAYSLDNLIKIKTTELQKVNQNYVKRIHSK